jgi:hypothetical protein
MLGQAARVHVPLVSLRPAGVHWAFNRSYGMASDPACKRFYPIGEPGHPWGAAEKAQWRAQQRKQRSYCDDV